MHRYFEYVARGAPYGPDDGTLAPRAIVASLPVAPELVSSALHHCIQRASSTEYDAYGLKASFTSVAADSKVPVHRERSSESRVRERVALRGWEVDHAIEDGEFYAARSTEDRSSAGPRRRSSLSRRQRAWSGPPGEH